MTARRRGPPFAILVRKDVSVFNHDANPAKDNPAFFITATEADRRVNKRYAFYLSPNSIQHRPPTTWTRDESQLIISGLFNQAWRPSWSAAFLVWQMRKHAEAA